MRKQKGQIAPWSFYRPLDDNDEEQRTSKNQKSQSIKQKKKIKDYQSQNRKKINEINEILNLKTKKNDTIKLQQYILPSHSIVSPSTSSVQLRDQITQKIENLLLISAIKATLQDDRRQRSNTQLKHKYQCLFPILKPKQVYTKINSARQHNIRNRSALSGSFSDFLMK